MQKDSIQDSTRYVVSEIHHGSILPGVRTELLRDVFLLSNADVRGGIWANDLIIKGTNVSVEESIYSRKTVTIKNADNPVNEKKINFSSTVVAKDSILVETKETKIRFGSEIYATKININNAFIVGNLYADMAVIRDSIILGGIFCKNKLEISNSMFATFRTKSVKLGKNLFIFFPVAISEEPFQVEYPIKALTFFNLLKTENQQDDSGYIILDNEDVFKLDDPKFEKINEGESENSSAKAENSHLYCLSLTERILDSDKIINSFDWNKKFLEKLSLGSHYNPQIKYDRFTEPTEMLENVLFDILDGKIDMSRLNGTEELGNILNRILEKTSKIS
jgi:hypothetical protein